MYDDITPKIYVACLAAYNNGHLHGEWIDATQDVTVLAPMAEGPMTVDFDKASTTDLMVADLERDPERDAQFLALPAIAGKAKSYGDWNKEFGGWLFLTQKME